MIRETVPVPRWFIFVMGILLVWLSAHDMLSRHERDELARDLSIERQYSSWVVNSECGKLKRVP